MKEEKDTRKASAAVVTTGGEMTNEEAQDFVREVVGQIHAEEEAKERELAKLPRTALVIPKDGTRPDGLTTRTAARIMFDGKEYFLTRAQRYVLNIFVYETDLKKTHKADKAAKAKFGILERSRYIHTRNAFFALYYFGIPVFNDAWSLQTAVGLFQDLPQDDEDTKENVQYFEDMNRLRLEVAFRCVEKFCEVHDFPRYLWPTLLQQARSMYEEACSPCLFDAYEGTINEAIFERMFDDYLKGCFAAQYDF